MSLRPFLFSVCVLALALGAGVYSLQQLRFTLDTQRAENETTSFLLSQTLYRGESLQNQFEKVLQQWQEALKHSQFDSRAYYNLGRAQMMFASLFPRNQGELHHNCEALKNFVQAARLSPHTALYRIAAVDVEAQLDQRGAACSLAAANLQPPEGSLAGRLAAARILSPLSITGLYWGAFVYLSLGEKRQALDMLRLNQEINPFFSEPQLRYLYSLVLAPDDLQHILPRRYPQVLTWIDYFRRERALEYLSWKEVFAQAFAAAVRDLESRYKQNLLTPELFSAYLKHMAGSSLVEHSESSRMLLDPLLAHVYQNEENLPWARVLEERAATKRIPVLKALITDDRHPETIMLSRWVEDENNRAAAIDSLGHTLGLYFPRGLPWQTIILESTQLAPRLSRDSLQLLTSDDNFLFQKLYKDYTLESFNVDGRNTVVIRFDKPNFSYLKISYTGSNQQPKFTNSFASLLQVYGATP